MSPFRWVTAPDGRYEYLEYLVWGWIPRGGEEFHPLLCAPLGQMYGNIMDEVMFPDRVIAYKYVMTSRPKREARDA